ncbi:hypothetical protein Tco_0618034 [Tanacetum coccineum]
MRDQIIYSRFIESEEGSYGAKVQHQGRGIAKGQGYVTTSYTTHADTCCTMSLQISVKTVIDRKCYDFIGDRIGLSCHQRNKEAHHLPTEADYIAMLDSLAQIFR